MGKKKYGLNSRWQFLFYTKSLYNRFLSIIKFKEIRSMILGGNKIYK